MDKDGQALDMTDFGSGLSVACMVKGDGSGDLCLPPLWDEDLAMLFTPVPEEDKPNDPDQCGYYWFPYDIYGKVAATMEKSYGVDFDIVWPKSAYVNAPKYFKDVGKEQQRAARAEALSEEKDNTIKKLDKQLLAEADVAEDAYEPAVAAAADQNKLLRDLALERARRRAQGK